MEEMVKNYGFASLKEFNHLVANIDLSTPEKLKLFKDWQHNDGTKEDLLKLKTLKNE